MTGTLNLDAFGVQAGSTGSSTDPYMYAATSGYRNDGDVGLSLVGARYYDAAVGRFITRDTDLNQKPYCYCDGDPVNATDPSGHGIYDGFVKLMTEAFEACNPITGGGGLVSGIGAFGTVMSTINIVRDQNPSKLDDIGTIAGGLGGVFTGGGIIAGGMGAIGGGVLATGLAGATLATGGTIILVLGGACAIYGAYKLLGGP